MTGDDNAVSVTYPDSFWGDYFSLHTLQFLLFLDILRVTFILGVYGIPFSAFPLPPFNYFAAAFFFNSLFSFSH